MLALEGQVDSSGQGFFSWLDTSELIALGSMALPREVGTLLEASGAAQLESLAFGFGVANGKGRLKLVADVGGLSTSRLLPVIDNEIAATSVGEPTSFLLLSIPDPAEFSRLENLALANEFAATRQRWDEAKTGITETMGVSLEDVLKAVGPELISYSDRAGEFIGLKVRDSDLLEDVLARLAANSGRSIEERRVGGQTIRHVSLPGIPAFAGDLLADNVSPWLRMISQSRTRLYFVEEGGYLYFAGLPQMLIDRSRLDADTDIGEWLEETQRLDLSASLFAATGSVANLPRKNYQFYVSSMQVLADLVGADYDVWSMPTAADLDLPERGVLGFSVNLGEPYVSVELAYESHPFELLFGGGGATAMAAVGIGAAIAIPAYQDFTVRRQVSEGMNLAAAAKAAVFESYLNSAVAPGDRAAAGMTPDASDTQGRYIESVDIVDGTIILRYGMSAHSEIAGRTLTITPYRDAAGNFVWTCGLAAPPPALTALSEGSSSFTTTIAPKYLASVCR
jgi:hypothetical protein